MSQNPGEFGPPTSGFPAGNAVGPKRRQIRARVSVSQIDKTSRPERAPRIGRDTVVPGTAFQVAGALAEWAALLRNAWDCQPQAPPETKRALEDATCDKPSVRDQLLAVLRQGVTYREIADHLETTEKSMRRLVRRLNREANQCPPS
jgi:hypothetical protein